MRNRVVLFASAILIAGCAVVQGAPQSDERSAPLRDEVLAGVRGFSDEQIDALVRLSADSHLISWLAENPARLAEPDRWPSPPQADVRLAAERLRELPELVEIAAAFPERLSELRRAWKADPRRVAARLAEMRHRFDQADSARRALWAEMLASDPLARGEYRDLLSRFCRAERASNPAFPCVQALDRDAYLHAPPDVLVLAFAERDSTGRALGGLLDRFIDRCEAERFEERALRGELANAPVRTVAAGKLATQVRDTSEPTPDSIGLLPAFLLPPELQSEDVRVALALAEQDRLWGMTAPTPMAPAFAADADPEAMTAAPPAVDPSMNGWADDDAAMDAPPAVAGLAPDPVVVFDDGPAFAPDVVVVERSAPTVFVDYGGIDTIYARPYGWPWSFSSTIVWGAPLYTAVCYPYIPVVATCRLAESRRWYSVHYGRSYRDWGGRCDSRRQLVFEARRSRGDCDRRGFSAVAAFGRVSDGGTRGVLRLAQFRTAPQ